MLNAAGSLILVNNKFQEKGVELQETAPTFKSAIKRFDASCIKCCMRNVEGRNDPCATCPIREALLANAAKWRTTNDKDDIWYIELEEASV